jgi:hypothetical protein
METFQALGIEIVSLSEQLDTSIPTRTMVSTEAGVPFVILHATTFQFAHARSVPSRAVYLTVLEG